MPLVVFLLSFFEDTLSIGTPKNQSSFFIQKQHGLCGATQLFFICWWQSLLCPTPKGVSLVVAPSSSFLSLCRLPRTSVQRLVFFNPFFLSFFVPFCLSSLTENLGAGRACLVSFRAKG
jgi:hypothetical protein